MSRLVSSSSFTVLGGLAILAAPLLTAPLAAQPAASESSEIERRRQAILDEVWRQIQERYYDPSFNGVDWSAVRARYLPQVSGIADDAAFLGLLRAMVGELRDAHTRVLSPQQARDRSEHQTTTAGVILFEVEGAPVVLDVTPEGPAGEAGLRPGMRVVAVNDVPVDEALARSRSEVGPSSSPRAARVLSYLRLIAGSLAEPLRLRLEREDGSVFDVSLVRRSVEASPLFEARRLASGPLYVRFDRFREPVARWFRAALEEHRDAPGLILDLRSNTGGDGEEGARVIGPLLDRPILIARLATRTGRPPSALLGLVRLPLELTAGQRGRQLYAGPVVILTNEGTASTSEVIAASLHEQGRARVIGARTCGCALGVLRYRRLPGGGALAISEVGLASGLGRRIEGEGLQPDITLALSRADLLHGDDPVLNAAVRELTMGPE